ncbi:MAG: chemotaxis protein CheD [Pseudomonadota bacterium]
MVGLLGAEAGRTLLTQGEVRIATSETACSSAILGSCIATLIWDPEARIGGINHLLTPASTARDPAGLGHDVNLMELLINGVLSAGGNRARLEAKMFGGARMIDGLGSTGATNTAFVETFLDNENIPCTARSTGGTEARRIRAWPAAGRVQQLRVRDIGKDGGLFSPRALRSRALRLSGVELL